tara:strand:- start:333 stop:2186 length:1854 start_codon:yes stop_codon:yes gene_type:complete
MKKYLVSYKKLFQEIHPTKNNNLQIENLTYGSNVKVWWYCSNGHSWKCSPKERTQKRSSKRCPVCRSFAYKRPDLLEEFDAKKNNGIDPFQIKENSSLRLNWLCKNCYFSFKASVNNRNMKNSGCPACSGSVVSDLNMLSSHSPELVSEWGKKNKKSPTEFSYGSDYRAYWECSTCAYEWRTSISHRSINKRSCPACSGTVVSDKNRLSIHRPKLLSEIHPTKNGDFDPSKVSYGTNLKIWWKCDMGHEWEAVIKNRSRGAGCPHCNPHTSRAELRLYAELEALFGDVKNREKFDKIEIDVFLTKLNVGIEYDGAFWHRGKTKSDRAKNLRLSKKGITIIRVREKPLKKVNNFDVVVEPKDLSLGNIQELIRNIINISNIPTLVDKLEQYLDGKNFIAEDRYLELLSNLPGPEPQKSLQYLKPKLSKSWDVNLNAPLTPMMFTPFSDKRVHWICQHNKSHRWEARIATRSQGYGCPFCAGKRINREDSFGEKHQKLLSEFDFEKNGSVSPFELAVGSKHKVWWICSLCNHNWRSIIGSRTKGHGCPKCGKKDAGKKLGKPVYCPELNLTFDSASHAAKELEKRGYRAHRANISSVCREVKKSHLGLTFQFIKKNKRI